MEMTRRNVAWNVQDFGVTNPKHTLVLADEFGFVVKEQLEQTKSIFLAPGSKTMNQGLHDGADVLDERERKRCSSFIVLY